MGLLALASLLPRNMVPYWCKVVCVLPRSVVHNHEKCYVVLRCCGVKAILSPLPDVQVLSSAHAVEREHAVLSALAGTPVPVPRVLCLCTDASVAGTPFYVMEHVKVRSQTLLLLHQHLRVDC